MKINGVFFVLLLVILTPTMILTQKIPIILSPTENQGEMLLVQERTPNLTPYPTSDINSRHISKNTAIISPTQYVPYDPISINNNLDFAALGFLGDGSLANPYIIEGLNITSAGRPLIHIQGTTVYFHIKYNFLNDLSDEFTTDGFPGILLTQVSHGTIASNIIINCTDGITLTEAKNNTLSNNLLANNYWGIRFRYASYNILDHNTIIDDRGSGILFRDSGNNTLVNNTISNSNYYGIVLAGSGNNTIVNNTLINNGLTVTGRLETCLQAKVEDNVVNDKPLVYWQNVVGETVPPGAGQVVLVNTVAVEVTGQDLSRASVGLVTAHSTNLNIHHNTINNNKQGIHIDGDNHVIAHNIITSCEWGIYLTSARNNIISYNTVSNSSEFGILLGWSVNNTLSNNKVIRCGIGIKLAEGSAQNILTYNHITNNWWGIILEDSAQNTLAHNIIIASENTGIHLSGHVGLGTRSWDNILTNNTVANNTRGIVLERRSQNITLTYNTVADNLIGIILEGCQNNTLAYNTVINNTEYGLFINYNMASPTSNNTVQWNDFLGNNPEGSSQARDEDFRRINVFMYNYWDDHDNTDRNGDGVADTPYPIDGWVSQNQDPSPLANSPATEGTLPPEIPGFEVLQVFLAIIFLLWLQKTHRQR